MFDPSPGGGRQQCPVLTSCVSPSRAALAITAPLLRQAEREKPPLQNWAATGLAGPKGNETFRPYLARPDRTWWLQPIRADRFQSRWDSSMASPGTALPRGRSTQLQGHTAGWGCCNQEGTNPSRDGNPRRRHPRGSAVSPHPGKGWEGSRERKKDGSANALERKTRTTESQAKAAQGGKLIPISSECGLQRE